MRCDVVYIGRHANRRFGVGPERSQGTVFTANAHAGIQDASLKHKN